MAILILISLVVYFVPTFIAYNCERNQRLAIFLLNLFLGWTILGWVAALVWSVIKNEDDYKPAYMEEPCKD